VWCVCVCGVVCVCVCVVWCVVCVCVCWPGTSVGIVTDYGLDGPESNFSGSRPAWGLPSLL